MVSLLENMNSILLSVVIPSYKDPLMVKTVDSLLANSELGDRLEIVVTLDGYWPSFELRIDPRVRYVHLGKNRGMRGAINAGVAVSRGKFILRSDEHCTFGKGYDRILTETCQDNWIVTARRFYLDPVKWELMDMPYVDYEKLVIQDCGGGHFKFAGQRWNSRSKERKDVMIDETMAMQGSVWMMPRSWWDRVIGELQSEGYGTHIQDSHEMQFKTWQAGGKLMLNKNTWFAHKHRSFPRTHNYGTAESIPGWDYSYNLWKGYYEEVRKKWGV